MKSEIGTLVLLWLFGICLRITVLAIPPVMPQIHQSFALSAFAVGALASLPVILFSIVAIPGSLLVARFGATHVLTAGILICGIASALRGAGDVTVLFGATFAMGIGIAIMQPALPAIVRDWVPRKVALGTVVYSNALLVGEAISASLTIPVVLPMVGGSWRLSMLAWAVPVIAIGFLALWAARQRREPAPATPRAPRLWWPDWSDARTWKLGLVGGFASSLYFCTNAFLPDYLASRGRGDLLGPALSALNWVQIPASVLLLLYANHLTKRRWPFIALAGTGVAALSGLILMPDGWIVPLAGLVGFCNAFMLILTLALPPLLAESHDVHRLSAAMIAIGYFCAVVTPIAGGLAWDATLKPAAAFAPILLFGLATILISWSLDFRDKAARS